MDEIKVYFIVSDLHSFYSIFRKSLENAGFDINNDNHILIVCGDIWDRGNESKELYMFLRYELPPHRRILIRGNHEYLLKDICNKKQIDRYDYSNGTARTIANLLDVDYDDMFYQYGKVYSYNEHTNLEYPEFIRLIINDLINSPYVEWLFSDDWVDYYELNDKYIFVHSFIPLIANDTLPMYYVENRNLSYFPEWRTNATRIEWEEATWGCPYKLFIQGLFNKEVENGNHTLICGHWQTNDFHRNFSDYDMWLYPVDNIFYSNNLIAIDGTTARSGKVNVLVYNELNDTFFDGATHNPLEPVDLSYITDKPTYFE